MRTAKRIPPAMLLGGFSFLLKGLKKCETKKPRGKEVSFYWKI
jgi:hypothetical protein